MLIDNCIKAWCVGSVTGAYLLGGVAAAPFLLLDQFILANMSEVVRNGFPGNSFVPCKMVTAFYPLVSFGGIGWFLGGVTGIALALALAPINALLRVVDKTYHYLKTSAADIVCRLARLSADIENTNSVQTGGYALQTVLGNAVGYTAYLLASITVDLAVKVVAPRYSGVFNNAVLGVTRQGAGYVGYMLGAITSVFVTAVTRLVDNLSNLYNSTRNGVDTLIARSHIIQSDVPLSDAPDDYHIMSYLCSGEDFYPSFNQKLAQYESENPWNTFVSLFNTSRSNNVRGSVSEDYSAEGESTPGVWSRLSTWCGSFFSSEESNTIRVAHALAYSADDSNNYPRATAIPLASTENEQIQVPTV